MKQLSWNLYQATKMVNKGQNGISLQIIEFD